MNQKTETLYDYFTKKKIENNLKPIFRSLGIGTRFLWYYTFMMYGQRLKNVLYLRRGGGANPPKASLDQRLRH